MSTVVSKMQRKKIQSLGEFWMFFTACQYLKTKVKKLEGPNHPLSFSSFEGKYMNYCSLDSSVVCLKKNNILENNVT